MKNRTWLCYALDVLGFIALLGAGFALLGALWFAASIPEPMLLVAFKYSLMGAVGAFTMARVCEITAIVRRNEVKPVNGTSLTRADNVESLPTPKRLPRAA